MVKQFTLGKQYRLNPELTPDKRFYEVIIDRNVWTWKKDFGTVKHDGCYYQVEPEWCEEVAF